MKPVDGYNVECKMTVAMYTKLRLQLVSYDTDVEIVWFMEQHCPIPRLPGFSASTIPFCLLIL